MPKWNKGTVGMVREFGGKYYEFAGKFPTKEEANRRKDWLYRAGWLARIVSAGKAGYYVYKREKGDRHFMLTRRE